MKKIILLSLLAIGMTGCSVESMDSEELLTADAKFKLQEAQDPMGFYTGPNLKGTVSITNDCDNLYIEIVPTGDDPTDAKLGVFAEGALPGTSGGSGNIKTDGFDDLTSSTDLIWTIPLNEATSFNIFINAWGDWAGAASSAGINQHYIAYTVDYSGCDDCEESFSYVANEDGSYTFTYIPEEGMEDAEVVFTLAQSDTDTGLEGWEKIGATKQKTMDLEACQEYSWTVTLTANCKGKADQNNAWTDFKVNTVSKKNDETPNITQICD